MSLKNALNEVPCRRLIRLYLLLALGVLAVCVTAAWMSNRQMEAGLVARESAVAGRLVAQHVDAQTVADAFTAQNLSAQEQTLGARVFAGRGYAVPTVQLLAPFFRAAFWQSAWFYSGVCAAALLAFAVCAVMHLSGIYRRIACLSAQAVEIGRGNGNILFDQSMEGILGRLQSNLHDMQMGMQARFDRLKQNRTFLKDLISDISHQLKTPLAALKMYQEILLQEPMERDARAFVVRSGEQIERMEWLVLGLLKMARIEAGQLTFRLRSQNLDALCRRVAEDFSHMAADKRVDLVVSASTRATLICDAEWLREAMGNVVKNCIECTPGGGCVYIEAKSTPVMDTLTVRDTGPGIHPDDLPFVFQRFYRGHGRTSSGSGIGLSLARAITEQMGGTLSAGGMYGQGAAFTFTFLR